MKQRMKQLALVLLVCTFSSAAVAQTWGSRPAQTTVQKNIVARANAANGQLSGQSTFQAGSQGCDYRGWCTDVSTNDGARMRNAMKRYYTWYYAKAPKESLDSVKYKMKTTDLYGASFDPQRLLDDASLVLLVNKIVETINYRIALGPFQLPTDDQTTLNFLKIQKQCLEWAMTTAISGGGQARSYGAGAVTDSSKWRAGMGLYMIDKSHAMIIVDIGVNAQGQPTYFKVAEANYGKGWRVGMVPWSRTAQTGRIVAVSSNMKVVSYE